MKPLRSNERVFDKPLHSNKSIPSFSSTTDRLLLSSVSILYAFLLQSRLLAMRFDKKQRMILAATFAVGFFVHAVYRIFSGKVSSPAQLGRGHVCQIFRNFRRVRCNGLLRICAPTIHSCLLYPTGLSTAGSASSTNSSDGGISATSSMCVLRALWLLYLLGQV